MNGGKAWYPVVGGAAGSGLVLIVVFPGERKVSCVVEPDFYGVMWGPGAVTVS